MALACQGAMDSPNLGVAALVQVSSDQDAAVAILAVAVAIPGAENSASSHVLVVCSGTGVAMCPLIPFVVAERYISMINVNTS